MNRTIVIDPLEPAPVSFRQPVGVGLDLRLSFLSQSGVPVDPTAFNPQLVLTSRSAAVVAPYDLITLDPTGGVAQASVPGNLFTDRSGYRLEVYQRDTNDQPLALMASGEVQLTGGSYDQVGPLGPLTLPVVAGPPGPPGPTGHRGSIWTTGHGAPAIAGGEQDGDMYLDTDTGNVWRFNGVAWTL